ncbi:NXPE family member 3-like [Haliotis cracherodii]|uniref:NXPE family member 3-like n=1 Tax=Haliotis cracherodii TaxID=6455 RepID=UPI0039E7D1F9
MDPKTCSYAPHSNIQLASSKTDFRLGDTISVEIQLFDAHKRRKNKGGDNVRVWMSETSKDARAAGVVTDNKDGTYTGTLKALWTGSPKVEAAIASRKENVDIFYRVYHDYYTLRNLSAMFESDGVQEETLCLPIPNIRGFENVCNLTAENYGLPWYCGKPSHRKLLCHDFTGLREPDKQPSLFTPHEAKFFESGQHSTSIGATRSGEESSSQTRAVTVSQQQMAKIESGDAVGNVIRMLVLLRETRWGGPIIMVWGGIGLAQWVGPVVFQNTGQRRSNGVTAARYKS